MSELLDTDVQVVDGAKTISNFSYPLKFSFKIGTLANDFVIKDSAGSTQAYVRQKMFKFIDEIQVFNNEKKSQVLYTIKANKWIDFSASYIFSDANGNKLGRVARKGMASIWKARYEIYDKNDEYQFTIQEDNGWTKVFDAMLSEIPLLGMFSGYMFNPKYTMKKEDGTEVFKLKKDPSMLGRHFSVSKVGETTPEEEENAALSWMMMILMERRRG
jgi:uncharacterized protein YxjI